MGHDERSEGWLTVATALDDNNRSLYMNLLIVAIFIIFIGTFIWYFIRSDTSIKAQRIAMRDIADTFNTSITNAHWQWRAEGSPNRIILVTYNMAGQETNRRPVTMSHLGWPRVEPNSEGCEKVWDTILDIPLRVHSFNVYAEFFDGLQHSGKILDSMCRFRISTGPNFEYKIYTGQVFKYDE